MRDRSLVLPTLIAKRALERPDHVFVEEVGGVSLTYAEYDEAIRRWAEALRRIDVEPGDRVVTMLPASAEASCAWLGLASLRAVEVPCSTEYRGRMLEHLLSNSQARTVVIADRYLDRLAELPEAVGQVSTVVVLGSFDGDITLPCRILQEEEFFAGVEPADDLPIPEPWDLCALLYTSGTTGPSKGVRFPWAQLYAQGTGFIPLDDLDDTDAWYMPYPVHHVSGKTPFYTMILVNGRIVIRSAFDTAAFWSDIDRYRCTSTAFLGPMAAFLWQQERRSDDADHALRNVFMVPLVPYLDEFKTRFGVRVATSYGSVENSVPIRVPGWSATSATWRSCGRLREGYPGYEVRIVDEHDREVESGQVGELIIRSSEPWTMNDGYHGMPEQTAEAWRNGWFHTGDALSCDGEGNFYFVDRAKDCIRRRGENVSSFDVETEVNAHPSVVESAAIGVPSEYGEEEIKICVVTKPGATLTPEGLIEFLIPRLPRFMVPRYIEFVDEFPKTQATLRVRKFLLRENALNEATWDRERAASRSGRE